MLKALVLFARLSPNIFFWFYVRLVYVVDCSLVYCIGLVEFMQGWIGVETAQLGLVEMSALVVNCYVLIRPK